MFENQLVFEEIEEYGVSEYELHGRGCVLVDLIREKMCYLPANTRLKSCLPCHEEVLPLIQSYDPDLQVVIVIHYEDPLGETHYFQEIRNLLVNQRLLN